MNAVFDRSNMFDACTNICTKHVQQTSEDNSAITCVRNVPPWSNGTFVTRDVADAMNP